MQVPITNKSRGLTLHLLRTFIAIAETRQITLAANRLHLTQSAVSQQIKKIELLLEVQLLDRKPDDIALTHHGERLIPRAYKLLALADELFNDMHAPDYSNEIRLGVPTDIVASLLPPVLTRFKKKYPEVLITLISDVSHVLRTELEAGKIDITIVTESQKGNSDEFLVSDRLVWAGIKDSCLSQQRPLSVALGNETCAFRHATTNALNQHGIPWRAVCQIGSLEPVFATLKSDMAIGAFLSMTIPETLCVLKDSGLPELPWFHLNMKRGTGTQSPIVNALADDIFTELSQLSKKELN
ncbi:MAG: DNA-binding transcriptional LysR family regulator [Candidatus Endobugula sp.]|jgi:DNA-binding transcriptional LysR family regulator